MELRESIGSTQKSCSIDLIVKVRAYLQEWLEKVG